MMLNVSRITLCFVIINTVSILYLYVMGLNDDEMLCIIILYCKMCDVKVDGQ